MKQREYFVVGLALLFLPFKTVLWMILCNKFRPLIHRLGLPLFLEKEHIINSYVLLHDLRTREFVKGVF